MPLHIYFCNKTNIIKKHLFLFHLIRHRNVIIVHFQLLALPLVRKYNRFNNKSSNYQEFKDGTHNA